MIDNKLNKLEYEQSMKYYLDILDGFEEVKIPKDNEISSSVKSFKISTMGIDEIRIEEFCSHNHISLNILFMASTLLTLDKFTYSTKSSLTDHNLNNNLLLVVNRDNRNQTIESFLKNVDDGLCSALKHSKWSIEEFFPNEDISSTIAYKYLEDDSTLHLFECESDFEIIFVKTNENKFSINLHYNSYLYSSKYSII